MILKRKTVLFCLILMTVHNNNAKDESKLNRFKKHPPTHPHFLITFQKVLNKNGDVTYKEVSKKQVISHQSALSNKHENIRQNKLTNPQQENLFRRNKDFQNQIVGTKTKKIKKEIHPGADAANEIADFFTGSTFEKFSPDEVFNNFIDKLVGYLKPMDERSDQVTEDTTGEITTWTWSSTITAAITFIAFILYL